MRIKLDPRLQAVADMVLPGKAVADIGTDHNYLPAYLVGEGICPFAVASDKMEGPYQKALSLTRALGMEDRISVRLGDGLDVLFPGEAATVILAGMGGFLMTELLDRAPAVLAKTERLILQPQKNSELCRDWLAAHGWNIIAETAASDKNFYYFVMAAEAGAMRLTEEERLYGPCLLKEMPQSMRQYLQTRYTSLCALERELSAQGGEPARSRREALKKEVERIRQILVRAEKTR